MDAVIFVAGLAVIAGIVVAVDLRSTRRNADAELQRFARTVPAPLTDDVTRWLRPQLVRRRLYPTVGLSCGIAASNIPLGPGWHEVPWYWFAGLVGAGAGLAAGTLVAGYRTAPLLDGPTRTADPVRRGVADHYSRHDVLRLRASLVLAVGALVVAAAIVADLDGVTGRRAFVACVVGLVLVVAHHRVAAALIARPVVASTAEGLVWQRAVLARTIEPMPGAALFCAVFGAGIALFATVVSLPDLGPPVVALATALAVLTVGVTAVAVSSDLRHGRWPLLGEPIQRTTP